MKSKIEEKIKNAREATNEMFAAFDELNERLSEKIEPKFAEGEFVRTFDGYIFKVSHKTINTQKTEWLYCKNPNVTYFGNYIEESKLEKYELKHKEPIIGEMAIFWDTDNKKAFCATLNSMINGRYSPDGNIRFDNAILFESPEQYKAFLKS